MPHPTTATQPASLYPLHIARELQRAAWCRDYDLIDEITDQLVLKGLARPRNEINAELLTRLRSAGMSS